MRFDRALTALTTLSATAMLLAGCASSDPMRNAIREPDSARTVHGVVVRMVRPGWGATPAYDDKVRLRYRGYFADGKEFDRSGDAEFETRVDDVMVCWTEGLQAMRVGGKATFTCPPSTAYGDKGSKSGLIPGDTVIRFDIELLSIVGR
jgi:FKBP-type peptidyl-prolyl cis-trans isomerase FkpA